MNQRQQLERGPRILEKKKPYWREVEHNLGGGGTFKNLDWLEKNIKEASSGVIAFDKWRRATVCRRETVIDFWEVIGRRLSQKFDLRVDLEPFQIIRRLYFVLPCSNWRNG